MNRCNLRTGRHIACATLIALLLCAGFLGNNAYAWPDRPIRLVLPFPPGGSADGIARALAVQVGRQLGQNVVIDNRAGANGIIAADIVTQAQADGYAILHTTSSIAVNPSVYKTLPYNLRKGLVPITQIARLRGFVFVVHSSVPAASLTELITLAKRPGPQITYGTPGIGNVQHVLGELFNERAGTKLLHVPYKGVGPAFTALLAGEVKMMITTPDVVQPHLAPGRLKALAFTGEKRWPGMPQVPTMTESAIRDFYVGGGWIGWFAPPGTPAAIVNRLQTETAKALQVTEVRDFIVRSGWDPVGDTPAEFRKFVDAEVARFAGYVKAAGIEAR